MKKYFKCPVCNRKWNVSVLTIYKEIEYKCPICRKKSSKQRGNSDKEQENETNSIIPQTDWDKYGRAKMR